MDLMVIPLPSMLIKSTESGVLRELGLRRPAADILGSFTSDMPQASLISKHRNQRHISHHLALRLTSVP
jgi:hypothetical protein